MVRAAQKAEQGGLRRYLEYIDVCLREQGSPVKSMGAAWAQQSGVTCMLGSRLGICIRVRKPPSPYSVGQKPPKKPMWRAGFQGLGSATLWLLSAFLWVLGDKPVDWGWCSQTLLGHQIRQRKPISTYNTRSIEGRSSRPYLSRSCFKALSMFILCPTRVTPRSIRSSF